MAGSVIGWRMLNFLGREKFSIGEEAEGLSEACRSPSDECVARANVGDAFRESEGML